MKVFICSTCYDLLDLRQELFEELRDLGLDPILSEIKDSKFTVATESGIDSIETCLANVRNCDQIVVVLSQRYGPVLGGSHGQISATHREYNEAVAYKKPMLFYVRDRLQGEFASWKRNGRPEHFKTVWSKQEDSRELFEFMEAHEKLHPPDASAKPNNFFLEFRSSVDLRADLRQRLAPQAYRATAEKLIRNGEVPVLVAMGIVSNVNGAGTHVLDCDFINAGSKPAIGLSGSLRLGIHHSCSGLSYAPVAMPTESGTRPAIQFQVPKDVVDAAYNACSVNGMLRCEIRLSYKVAEGYKFEDCNSFWIRNGRPAEIASPPHYEFKSVTGIDSPLAVSG